MNSFSNIEFVNFDNFDDEAELEQPLNFNDFENIPEAIFQNNFSNDRFDTDSSEYYLDNNSVSACSDYGISNSCSNSVFGDNTILANNLMNLSLNDSFSQFEKETCNSFSYIPSNSKNKLSKYSMDSFDYEYSIKDVKYEYIGNNIILVDNDEIQEKILDNLNNKILNKNENKNFKKTGNSENNQNKKINSGIDKKENKKNFKCSYEGCNKCYKSKENLTLHYKNIHLNEKPYTCKFCKATFSHRNGKLIDP